MERSWRGVECHWIGLDHDRRSLERVGFSDID
jgi:hypothetical protein